MGEPAQAATSGEAPPPEDAAPTVSLQILSPSVGVNRPLGFSGLPASITIRQLKEKIRDALANKPTDDQQRLIHRGRLLARDTETLQDVFGVEAVRKLPILSLHFCFPFFFCLIAHLPPPERPFSNHTLIILLFSSSAPVP